MSVAYDVPPRVGRPDRRQPATVLSLAPRPDLSEADADADALAAEASVSGRGSAGSRPAAPQFETPTQSSAEALWVAAPLTEPDSRAGSRSDRMPTSLLETPVAVTPALLLLPPSRRSGSDASADLARSPIDVWAFDTAIDATLLRVEPAEPVVLDVDIQPDADFERIRPGRPASRPYVAPASVPAAAGVRLTVRGRRVVAAVCAIALMAAVFVTVIAVRAALTRPLVPASAPTAVTVHPGDTLWSIAERIAPQSDPRDVIAALRESNHLPSSTVRVGQHLHVPH